MNNTAIQNSLNSPVSACNPNAHQATNINEEMRYHGTELVMLYDYKVIFGFVLIIVEFLFVFNFELFFLFAIFVNCNAFCHYRRKLLTICQCEEETGFMLISILKI